MSMFNVFRLLLVVSVVTAQLKFPEGEKQKSGEKTTAAPAAAAQGSPRAIADSGAAPQTRFLGGLVQSLVNPCGRCGFHDQAAASQCCLTGHRQCCFGNQGGFGGGFGNQGGFGGHGGFGNQGGFHGNHGGFGGNHGGFGGGFGNQGGFGHNGGFPGNFNGGGFHGNQGGFNGGFGGHGGFQGNHGGFGGTTKPGFCPRSGRSSLRSGAAEPQSRSAAVVAEDKPKTRRRRQSATTEAAPAAADAPANTRFLNLFGPGPIIKNPFCRDECFTDRDCFGNLKCCISSCRTCTNPQFHG